MLHNAFYSPLCVCNLYIKANEIQFNKFSDLVCFFVVIVLYLTKFTVKYFSI